ncbi:hypothetical protein GEMRC1_001938 [Eukaryota sp. GEM-RC1]
MNSAIKESSVRLADYVLRFQDLKKQISHLIYKEDHFLSCFIRGISPSSVSSRVFSSFKNGRITSLEEILSLTRQLFAAMQLSYSLEEPRAQQPAWNRVTNRQPRNQLARSSRPSPSSSSHLTCAYCKEPGHVKADCPDPSCRASRFHRPLSTPQFPAHQNRPTKLWTSISLKI